MKACTIFRTLALWSSSMVAGATLGACEPDFDPSNELISLRVLAVKAGYKKVYWLRNGIAEWKAKGLPTE